MGPMVIMWCGVNRLTNGHFERFSSKNTCHLSRMRRLYGEIRGGWEVISIIRYWYIGHLQGKRSYHSITNPICSGTEDIISSISNSGEKYCIAWVRTQVKSWTKYPGKRLCLLVPKENQAPRESSFLSWLTSQAENHQIFTSSCHFSAGFIFRKRHSFPQKFSFSTECLLRFEKILLPHRIPSNSSTFFVFRELCRFRRILSIAKIDFMRLQ